MDKENYLTKLNKKVSQFYYKNITKARDITSKALNFSVAFAAGTQIMRLATSTVSNPAIATLTAMGSFGATLIGTYIAMRKINPMKDLNNSMLFKLHEKEMIAPLSKGHIRQRVKNLEKGLKNEKFKIRNNYIVNGFQLNLQDKIDLATGKVVMLRPEVKNGIRSKYALILNKNNKFPGGIAIEKHELLKKQNIFQKGKNYFDKNIMNKPVKVKHTSYRKTIVLKKSESLENKLSSERNKKIDKVKNIAKNIAKNKNVSQKRTHVKSKNITRGRFY